MIGLGASLVLVVATWGLVLLVDPSGRWPLGLANLVAFSTVVAAGWVWQKAGMAPAEPPRWAWGWPTLLPNQRVLTVLGVLLSAAGGSVVLGALSQVLAQWWPIPPALVRVFERLSNLSTPWEVLIPIVAIAALTEEALFRGLLLPSLAQRYGPAAAVALTALLFAALHLNPWQGLPALVAGVYLGALRLRTGGLALPLLAHGLFNGLPLVLALAGAVIPGYNDAAGSRMSGHLALPVLIGALVVLGLGVALTFRFRLFQRPVF